MKGVLYSKALQHPGISHGFFGRQGGYSSAAHARSDDLNCGYALAACRQEADANRARIARHVCGQNWPLVSLRQVHSADVIEVKAPFDPYTAPQADALVTTRSGLVLGVLSADCCPVLFCDPKAGIIGAAHAGWAGALKGVTLAVIEKMIGLGAQSKHIYACLGSAIQQESYEVGTDFVDKFIQKTPETAKFFIPAKRKEHWMFDLPGFIKGQLSTLDLASIDMIARDTCKEQDNFFSYRRSTKEKTPDEGRQMSAICLI